MGSPTVTWNPEQYLKFGDHRLRPALDLLARIDLKSPQAMYDLGCGTGNTTELLTHRWPDTIVTCIDSSPEMLEEGRGSCLELNFAEADLASWSPESKAGLLFSNAALCDPHQCEDPSRSSDRPHALTAGTAWRMLPQACPPSHHQS